MYKGLVLSLDGGPVHAGPCWSGRAIASWSTSEHRLHCLLLSQNALCKHANKGCTPGRELLTLFMKQHQGHTLLVLCHAAALRALVLHSSQLRKASGPDFVMLAGTVPAQTELLLGRAWMWYAEVAGLWGGLQG